MKHSCLCLVALSLATGAFADRVPTEWKTRYHMVEKSFEAKDLPAWEHIFSDDLVWVQVDGKKKNRKETLAEFAEMFKSSKITCHERLIKVSKHGRVYDVDCEVFMTIVNPGKTDMKYHSFCVDSWQKIGGAWKMVKTRDKVVDVKGG